MKHFKQVATFLLIKLFLSIRFVSLFQHTYNNDTEEEFTGYIPLGN